jgi:hypothetical protein
VSIEAPYSSCRAHETKAANHRFETHNAAQAAGFWKFGNVATYRLYCLDGLSKVASAEWIEADDDGRAVELAKDMMDGQPCELWQGGRLVARIARDGGLGEPLPAA